MKLKESIKTTTKLFDYLDYLILISIYGTIVLSPLFWLVERIENPIYLIGVFGYLFTNIPNWCFWLFVYINSSSFMEMW